MHHGGRCARCGRIVQPITPSRNRVSRAVARQVAPAAARRAAAWPPCRAQCHSASASRQRRWCAVAAAGRDLAARQAQAVVQALLLGLQHPGRQARQARFGVAAGRRCAASPATARGCCACWVSRLTSSPACARLLPHHRLQRVAAAVGAHAVELAAALAAARRAGAAGARLRRGQRRRRLLGRAGRPAPARPAARRVQARNRPSGKRVSAVSVGTACRPRAAARRLSCALACPAPARRTRPSVGRAAASGTAGRCRGAARARRWSARPRAAPRCAGEDRRRRRAGAASGRAACRASGASTTTAAAGQQEGQQVAQVELVVDRGHQQHQQRSRQGIKPARVGRM